MANDDAFKNTPMSDLQAMSMDLAAEEDKIRAQRKLVNKELAFRENVEMRMKAIKGMSAQDIMRVLELSQSVSVAGDIASGEAVDGLGPITQS